jgi:hypothetical protein
MDFKRGLPDTIWKLSGEIYRIDANTRNKKKIRHIALSKWLGTIPAVLRLMNAVESMLESLCRISLYPFCF